MVHRPSPAICHLLREAAIRYRPSAMDEPGFTLANARVAIVGLGLMGGSLALALRGRCREIVGADSDPAALRFALDHAIVDRAADFDSALDCDLLLLAAPVRAIRSELVGLSGPAFNNEHTPLILDPGSTKNQIV